MYVNDISDRSESYDWYLYNCNCMHASKGVIVCYMCTSGCMFVYSRVLLYADVPAGNLLCGDMMSRRRKRDASSSQSAYDVPQELLVQVMNGTEAGETVMMVRTAMKSRQLCRL